MRGRLRVYALEDSGFRQHGKTQHTLQGHAMQVPSQLFVTPVSSVNTEERNTRLALPTRERVYERMKSLRPRRFPM